MKKKTCLAVITALLIIGCWNVAQALTSSDLEQKKIELQNKIQQAGKSLENIEINLTENLTAINKLDEEIYGYETQINEISKNLKQIDIQIKDAEIQLKIIQITYDHQKELLEQRLVCLYEAGSTKYLDVLLNSKSIVDFITNYYLIAEVAQYDKDLLESIERERNKIEEIEKSLELSKENLKILKTEQRKIIVSLENSKVIKSSYSNNLTKEELKIREEINMYQEELDIIELEILLLALENNNSQYVGGTFAWPTPGYYTITSSYGMRLHPILKIYRNHSGMDIGAPQGTYIIAANDGIVTKATYSYSYGNIVMIDHGGGITTVYAHGLEIISKVGDIVKRGEAIMRVGSTGWSTGPHLHFEIRINGTTIDPYPYVTSTITNSILNSTENQINENIINNSI